MDFWHQLQSPKENKKKGKLAPLVMACCIWTVDSCWPSVLQNDCLSDDCVWFYKALSSAPEQRGMFQQMPLSPRQHTRFVSTSSAKPSISTKTCHFLLGDISWLHIVKLTIKSRQRQSKGRILCLIFHHASKLPDYRLGEDQNVTKRCGNYLVDIIVSLLYLKLTSTVSIFTFIWIWPAHPVYA